MVKGNALLLVLGLLLQQFALVESAGVRPQNNRVLDECDGVSNDECNGGGSSETPEHGTGSTPNRVSQVNKNGADCAPAANSERGGDTLPKIITFYYRIDSPSEIGPDQVKEIENRIFQTILPAIVWCILPPEPEDDVSGGNRMLPESTDGAFVCVGIYHLVSCHQSSISLTIFFCCPYFRRSYFDAT